MNIWRWWMIQMIFLRVIRVLAVESEPELQDERGGVFEQ